MEDPVHVNSDYNLHKSWNRTFRLFTEHLEYQFRDFASIGGHAIGGHSVFVIGDLVPFVQIAIASDSKGEGGLWAGKANDAP